MKHILLILLMVPVVSFGQVVKKFPYKRVETIDQAARDTIEAVKLRGLGDPAAMDSAMALKSRVETRWVNATDTLGMVALPGVGLTGVQLGTLSTDSVSGGGSGVTTCGTVYSYTDVSNTNNTTYNLTTCTTFTSGTAGNVTKTFILDWTEASHDMTAFNFSQFSFADAGDKLEVFFWNDLVANGGDGLPSYTYNSSNVPTTGEWEKYAQLKYTDDGDATVGTFTVMATPVDVSNNPI